MLRIAICDDNNKICSEVEQMILEYEKAKRYELDIEVFYTGESLIEFIKNKHPFDLIFLDIELGTLTGVDVGKTIRNVFRDHISKIVFVSGADGYEMDLFCLQPLNFLRKPIMKNNIVQCINLAIEIFDVNNIHFEYRINHQIKKVAFKDIIYFESRLKKIKIVTIGSVDEFYGSLEKIKTYLPKMFILSHRSFIINFSNIICIQKDALIMTNGESVPISQRNLKNIRTLQIEFEKEKRDARL